MTLPVFSLRPWAWALLGAAVLGHCALAQSPQRVRAEVKLPDLPGYVTLKCDFHLHSVFSDGTVWPSVRVEEAWRHGLDAIALTDHIEYLPHAADIPTNHGRSFEIARAAARSLNLIVVNGAEITKGEPPGHLNALFVTNVAAIDHVTPEVAVSNAFAQGAFLFWNHPGWKQPDQQTVWYPEQGAFLTNGWLHGLEIVNGRDYDRIVHGWAVEKNLALLGNSDIHDPIAFDYSMTGQDLRPVTLVFARERSPEAIKEALFARRTAVMSEGKLYGSAEHLRPLFDLAIEVLNPELVLPPKATALVQIRNRSSLDFQLRLNPRLPELDVVSKVTLPAGKVALMEVMCPSDRVTGEHEIALPCKVINLVTAPGRYLDTSIKLKVSYPGK